MTRKLHTLWLWRRKSLLPWLCLCSQDGVPVRTSSPEGGPELRGVGSRRKTFGNWWSDSGSPVHPGPF